MFVLSFLGNFIKEFLWQILILPVGLILIVIASKIEDRIRAYIKKRKQKNENHSDSIR